MQSSTHTAPENLNNSNIDWTQALFDLPLPTPDGSDALNSLDFDFSSLLSPSYTQKDFIDEYLDQSAYNEPLTPRLATTTDTSHKKVTPWTTESTLLHTSASVIDPTIYRYASLDGDPEPSSTIPSAQRILADANTALAAPSTTECSLQVFLQECEVDNSQQRLTSTIVNTPQNSPSNVDPDHLSSVSFSCASPTPSLLTDSSSVVPSPELPTLSTFASLPLTINLAPFHRVALPPTSYNAALPQGLASEAFLTELMNPYTIPNITAINHNGIRGQYLPLSIEAQMLENLKKRKFGEPFESVNTPAPPSYAPLNNNEASMSAEVLFYYRQLQRNMNQAQHLQQQTGGNEYKNNDISPEDQKSSREKKVTSSSHYRARNAFFMFRGYVSRIQSTTLPKFKSDNSTVALSLARPLSSNTSSLSPATTLPTPPDKVRSLAQTKVSVRCGIIWKSPCLESCKRRECANCRMRRVFRRASNYMKLRHAELECQIEDDPLPKKQKSETIDTKIESTDHVTTHDGDDGDDDGARKLAYMPLEKSFDWDEFERYYYESDLFAWHREEYLGSNGVLDLEELKRVWIENEKWNEQSFLKGARKRMAEVGSPNATNNGGMKTRTKS